MKREKCAAFVVSFFMACLLSIGAMGSMVSGLELPVERMDDLFLVFCVCALVGCIVFLFKKGWIAALVIAAAGITYLWQEYYLSLPIRALITRLSWLYDSAYGWGILEFAGVEWQEVSLDLPLAVWGCLIVLSAARTMMQGRGVTLTLLLTLLPLCATVVVTNTVPDPTCLYILMLGILLLLLTSTVRRQNPGQGAKLAVLTALPVALLLGLLFLSFPKDTYVNHSREQLNSVVAWFQSTLSGGPGSQLGQVSGTVGGSSTATTRLSSLGPRTTLSYPVMDVTSTESGTVYLRGQDYDTYTGSTWTSGEDREEAFAKAPGSYDDDSITIATRTVQNVLYLPYYPDEDQTLSGGRLDNADRLTEYTFVMSSFHTWKGGSIVSYDRPEYDLDEEAALAYLALPEETKAWVFEYIDRVLQESDTYARFLNSAPLASAKAAAIADHVRASAVYDTDTPRMSGDYDDFTQWFLEESDTGYCVHFATATAVLLRAAGVPARYVTGYMFNVEDGETVTVTADRAHAWVEYYEPELGAWIVLESTPADLREEETEPEETEATETEPEETETEETDPPSEAPTDADEQPTRPDSTQSGEKDDPEIDLTGLWTALKWLLIPVGIWLAVLLQYALRRKLRRKGSGPNARALALWQEVELLCRFTKQDAPEELEALAQKAKFSQHTLTAEELQFFHTWLREERNKLQQKPWYVRFVCKYILVLW